MNSTDEKHLRFSHFGGVYLSSAAKLALRI
jgi:hypothetical protein